MKDFFPGSSTCLTLDRAWGKTYWQPNNVMEFQSRESGEMPEQPRYCDRDETVISHCLRMGRHGSRMNGSQETCWKTELLIIAWARGGKPYVCRKTCHTLNVCHRGVPDIKGIPLFWEEYWRSEASGKIREKTSGHITRHSFLKRSVESVQ